MTGKGKYKCLLLSMLLCFLRPVVLCPEENPQKPEPQTIPRIEGKIAVDGKLDEAVWQQALALDLPFETDPGENIPALVKTTVRVFYNKDNIYFGLDCFDLDPSQIRSRYAERDQIDADSGAAKA